MPKEISTNTAAQYNSLTNESRIVGKIVTENDFRIDGEIEGDISCNGKIVVGENGYLRGSISCISAEVIGKVEGNITSKEMVLLRSTAYIKSRVITGRLQIEPNAVFDGSCIIKSNVNFTVTE